MIDQYPSQNGVLTSLIWRKTAAGGETSLSGYDNANQALSYTPGQEQVYLNGILLVRGDDYTATNGTSITGLAALAANDFVQINCYNNFSVASVPATSITGEVTNSQITSLAASKLTGTIANNQLANSSITINGSAVSLGGSVSLPGDIESVTAGTGLSGGGNSGAVTVSLDTTSQFVVPSQSGHNGKYLTTNGSSSSWGTVDLSGKTDKSTLTTTGDIYYASAANTPARLGIGSTGQVLTVSGGVPVWQNDVYSPTWTQVASGSLGGTNIRSITGINSEELIIYISFAQNTTGDAPMTLMFNNNTNSYHVWGQYYAGAGGISISHYLGPNSLIPACAWYIPNAKSNLDKPVILAGNSGYTYTYDIGGIANIAAPITSIQIKAPGVGNFTQGTYVVYGRG